MTDTTEWHIVCPTDNCNGEGYWTSAVGNTPNHCPYCGSEANAHPINE